MSCIYNFFSSKSIVKINWDILHDISFTYKQYKYTEINYHIALFLLYWMLNTCTQFSDFFNIMMSIDKVRGTNPLQIWWPGREVVERPALPGGYALGARRRSPAPVRVRAVPSQQRRSILLPQGCRGVSASSRLYIRI